MDRGRKIMKRRFLLLLSVIALAFVIFAGCDGGNGGSSENGQSADHAHHLITVEAHEGSCTEDGWKEYVYCDVEGCGYTTKNVIKAKGHSIVKVDEKAPACLEDGNNSYEYCKNDGCDYATEKIITPALGHDIEKVAAKQSTCKEAGWNEYERCRRKGCDYSTKTELPKKEHELLTAEAKAPTCHEAGWDEYRYCKNCDYSEKIELPTTGHNLVTAEAKAPTCSSAGWAAYKYCSNKGCDYSEKVEIPMMDHDVEKGKCKNCDFTVKETVDFYVEVPEGRKPVVLQLTDPQILDSAQDRTNRLGGGEKAFYATENVGKLCFDYITETINAVKPDLIVMTGDLVYGEFDDSGASFIKFVNFMETFGIPWAPVMGNHEGTSRKGYDWQCKILENAKNCMFLQRTLTDAEHIEKSVNIPIVNGNPKSGPLEALAALYTVWKEKGRLSDLKITFFGDPAAYAESIAYGFANCGFEITFVCPEELKPSPEIYGYCRQFGDVNVTSDVRGGVKGADVIFVSDDGLSHRFDITNDVLSFAKPDVTVLHTLPVDTDGILSEEVISSPRFAGLKEAEYLPLIDMAVMSLLVNKAD